MPQVANRPASSPAATTRPGRVLNTSAASPLASRQPGNRPLVQRTPAAQRGFVRPDGQPGRAALFRPVDRMGSLAKPARLDPTVKGKWGNWGNWRNPDRAFGSGSGAVAARTTGLDPAFISRNFRRSVNWSYCPTHWGSNPWWTARACHSHWHFGHWNYGWNPYWYHHHCHWYYEPCFPGYYVYTPPISWGLACWGLGSLVYDTGYYVYSNPYLPEPYIYDTTVISYEQPMSVIARDYPTGDEVTSDLAATRSAEALERSRTAFRNEDYLTALKDVDEAISHQPGDSALHEYRALVLFALGKYRDAAGVLHPVLASGPGWDRETMIGLYAAEDSYLAQLGKLEQYVAVTSDEPAPRFLLGYHYLVGGELDRAASEFDEVIRLRPNDSTSSQLRNLAKSSVKSASGVEPPPPAGDTAPEPKPEVETLSPTQLVGTWRSDRAENGIVTLNLRDDAGFSWNFKKGDLTPTDLTGTWEIDRRGLLVLTTSDAQMVGEVKLDAGAKMTFILAGGAEGDPGLTFDRVP
jgi:hypothetical protein